MKKIKITEVQFKEVLKDTLNEQGLYGNNSDVVDYDLPEFLSDTIILSKFNSLQDVQKAVKELYKRMIRVEKGLDDAGSHNKAYTTDTKYASQNKKFKSFEKKGESEKRDEELSQEIKNLQDMIASKSFDELESKKERS